MTTRRRSTRSALFAELMLVACATALVGVVAFAFRSPEPAGAATESDAASGDAVGASEGVDLDDGAVADPDVDVDELMSAAATEMGEVTSVEFSLERSGAPIYIDEFESIAIDSMRGQFAVPDSARAQLQVTVDGDLATEIGAVAVGGEVWISNPVTGDFEPLPPGIDIDPSRFFDPQGGWQPLLANLRDVELVGIDDRGGDRYHVRGVAAAADVEDITVGLVRDQDVPIDLWIHPTTSLVTHLEFDTTIDGAASEWSLELGRYGEPFTIVPPTNVRTESGS